MTNNTSLNLTAFSIFLAMICFSLGCEQQRYSPSTWTPATNTNGTLPGVGQLNDGSASSLPGRDDTLPGRAGMGTRPNRNYASTPWRAGNRTLPSRGGTLPSRQQIVVRKPKKPVKPALPSLEGKLVWDDIRDGIVPDKREMPPVPGKPGLYMGDTGIIGFPSVQPQRSSFSTLPGRNGTTLPARAKKANWSTLPGRE